MLYIYFGHKPGELLHIDEAFDLEVETEWFNDKDVKRMIEDIDKSVVVKDRYIESPYLGAISPKELSTGVKGLILMKMWSEQPCYCGQRFGDNTLEWVCRISKTKDIYISTNHVLKFPLDLDFEATLVNWKDKVVHNSKEYFYAWIEWYHDTDAQKLAETDYEQV